jgi:hypothetical protein
VIFVSVTVWLVKVVLGGFVDVVLDVLGGVAAALERCETCEVTLGALEEGVEVAVVVVSERDAM